MRGAVWMIPTCGISLHQRDQLHQRPAGHDRIGIQHDHVTITPAPPPQEVGDVARLLVDRLPALPIKNLSESADLLAEFEPRDLLLRSTGSAWFESLRTKKSKCSSFFVSCTER